MKFKWRRILCRLNLHRWTRWKDNGLNYIDYEATAEGFHLHYKQLLSRRCRTCRITEELMIDLK